MKNIQTLKTLFAKHVYVGIAVELVLAILMTALPFGLGSASAAGQLTSRSITMSDSGPSGGTITSGEGDGLNVVYKVTFSAASSATVGGIVIEFCTNSPLVFDTCTAPTGFSNNNSTLSINNQTNLGAGAFAVSTTATTQLANKVTLTRATPTTPTGSSSFELGNGTTNGITNPTAIGTFYARVYTYATSANANGHIVAANSAQQLASGVIDNGGVALAIASVIQITARVQENIIFCVSAAAPSANCGGQTTPKIDLGHGSTAKIIDSSAIDTGTVYTQLSTNAATGATVRMRNNTASGGLETPGGSSIPPVNAGASTAPSSAMVAGTAAFGLTVATATGVTPAAPYANVTANYYGNDTTSANSAITTYGSTVLSSSGPVSNVNNLWTFAATASNTSAAGVYSANISVIATGTF